MLKHKALAAAGYDGKITVSPEAKKDLLWWANNLRQWNGHTMARVGSQMAIEADASRAGWVVFCQGEATGGCWTREKQMLHINMLEMLVVSFLCKHHCRFLVQTHKTENRLDSERYLQSNQPNLGSSAGGTVCNSFFYSTTAVFQLEADPEAEATDAFSQS